MEKRDLIIEAVGNEIVSEREISCRTDIPKTTVHRLINQLVEDGLLEKCEEGVRKAGYEDDYVPVSEEEAKANARKYIETRSKEEIKGIFYRYWAEEKFGWNEDKTWMYSVLCDLKTLCDGNLKCAVLVLATDKGNLVAKHVRNRVAASVVYEVVNEIDPDVFKSEDEILEFVNGYYNATKSELRRIVKDIMVQTQDEFFADYNPVDVDNERRYDNDPRKWPVLVTYENGDTKEFKNPRDAAMATRVKVETIIRACEGLLDQTGWKHQFCWN